jgi:hypothetical protein
VTMSHLLVMNAPYPVLGWFTAFPVWRKGSPPRSGWRATVNERFAAQKRETAGAQERLAELDERLTRVTEMGGGSAGWTSGLPNFKRFATKDWQPWKNGSLRPMNVMPR